MFNNMAVEFSTGMDSTTAPLYRPRGVSQRISFHKNDLVKVQTLYGERKYKQSVTFCEELLKPQVC
jgi:hypothetical protein